jgi:putative ATP-dependent endonuclease of the OLD family
VNLSSLSIKNYRGLRDISMPLSNFVCITGENNAGKSSVLQALSLFISGSTLKPTDYFDPTIGITFAVEIKGISNRDLDLLAPEHRARIEGILVDRSIKLVREYGTDYKSQLGYYGMAPKEQRFWDAEVTKLMAGKGAALRDAVTQTFPELAESLPQRPTQAQAREKIQSLADSLPLEAKEERFNVLPTGLDKSILPMLPERIYIPAVKELSDETKTAETSSFGKILAIVMKSIEPLLAEEKDLFEKLSRKLTRLPLEDGTVDDHRLSEIREIERLIQSYVRESFASVNVELEIPPPELKSVLSTARIIVDDGMKSGLEQKGDGLRRAVVFSILRTYVAMARAAARNTETADASERGYLLLFEEPELFLHPDAQKILFEALGVFAKNHHVVVTTHSPLFLGPDATATFVRLSKTKQAGVSKAFTKAYPVALNGINPRDEFQVICFESNNAAFFAKRIVLVEGDSDLIAFPHIAQLLEPEWNCRTYSVAFVRVGGKGSFARYRSFFTRFDVPVFIITDLDALLDGFEKLDPGTTAKNLQSRLIQVIDGCNEQDGAVTKLKTDEIKQAHSSYDLRHLWNAVKLARQEYQRDRTAITQLDAAVDAFFAWEKKNIRRDCLQKAEHPSVRQAKLDLIWELRKDHIFVLEQGALDDYYPTLVVGPDKPSRAQDFARKYKHRVDMLALSPNQTCPVSHQTRTEFEFICATIFGN